MISWKDYINKIWENQLADCEIKPAKKINGPMDDLIETTIQNRVSAMARQMNFNLYGDRELPPTRLQRIKRKLSLYRQRISDAWLVLRGKAYIE